MPTRVYPQKLNNYQLGDNMYPTLEKDGYKEYHWKAAHPGVSFCYLNFTPRNGKHTNIPNGKGMAIVGLQYFMFSHLVNEWNEGFFELSEDDAVNPHKRIASAMLGKEVDVSYLRKLYQLGYLPLRIKALPEGTMVPYGVAPFTMVNTVEGFDWLPGVLETVTSTETWPIGTSATTARAYLKNIMVMAKATGLPSWMIPFMAHDFSFRGMFGKQAAAMSTFGHLSSGLVGTDTMSGVPFAEEYYGADCEKELLAATVDATEHGVTCQWLNDAGDGEIEFFTHLMTNITPTGPLSLVSDTRDFWKLVTVFLVEMKEVIMGRDGTLVIRPDSGDPVEILCGTGGYLLDNGLYRVWDGAPYDSKSTYRDVPEWECKGLIECLWDIFGGTVTDEGFKLLDSHIGAIYGDAITLVRQEEIYRRLMDKKFVPSVVLGVGSYSYQYVTRDTHGSAVKATDIVKYGEHVAIFKKPKTDLSKSSAKGLLRVEREDGKLVMYDNQTPEQEEQGLLETVFLDGVITKVQTIAEIRAVVAAEIEKEIIDG